MRFNRASHLVLPIENDPGHCLPKLVDSRETRSHVYRILIVGGGCISQKHYDTVCAVILVTLGGSVLSSLDLLGDLKETKEKCIIWPVILGMITNSSLYEENLYK